MTAEELKEELMKWNITCWNIDKFAAEVHEMGAGQAILGHVRKCRESNADCRILLQPLGTSVMPEAILVGAVCSSRTTLFHVLYAFWQPLSGSKGCAIASDPSGFHHELEDIYRCLRAIYKSTTPIAKETNQ